jgi:hypothetical protein
MNVDCFQSQKQSFFFIDINLFGIRPCSLYLSPDMAYTILVLFLFVQVSSD